MKKAYKIEVDCALCAQKVEDAIRKINGVKDVKVNFMTQKMIIEADDNNFEEIVKEALKVAKKIEPDFCIINK